jgi:hypothetical protein
MKSPMEHPIVLEAVQNNHEAATFLRHIANILHTWDDLVDQDEPVSDTQIHDCFWLALVELPRNGFYLRNFANLNPILVQAIVNWRAANEIERDEEASQDELITAFIIRSAYVDLLTMSANIIGGVDWAVSKARAIHAWAHSEGFDGYLRNLAAEKAEREGEE